MDHDTLTACRPVVLSAACNFREVGGLPAGAGRLVRRNAVFRADSPAYVDDADVAAVHGLGLRTVIDLRTVEEAATRLGWACHTDVTPTTRPMFDLVPTEHDLARWADPAHVTVRYREMLDGAEETIADVLAILTDPAAYPLLVHCTAGKDRTGIVVGLLLAVLGVPDLLIADDYARSASAMRRKIELLKAQHPEASDRIEAMRPALTVADPTIMLGLLDTIRADYGSIDGYLDAMGIATAAGFLRAALVY